jgi:hypothetical protein
LDEIRFENAKSKIIGVDRHRLGIGTLGEKTVHAVLKNYYEPDEDRQEIPIENYVADIYAHNEIIEIQTGQFNRMRDKLKAFLPLYKVTIVYPIPKEKWLIWVDHESGEMTKKRKSPKRGNPYMAFGELYKIKTFIKNPNLSFKLVFVDIEEYRLLNGWSRDKKKGSTRYDRIPVRLVEEVDIERLEDYTRFVPYMPGEAFTVKDFAKAAQISSRLAQTVVHILHYVEVLQRVGKVGRSFLYLPR